MISCSHHGNIVQNILTALKILCSSYSPLPPPEFLETAYHPAHPIVLPFPECHVIGVIQGTASMFSWLLSRSSVYSCLFMA